MSIISRAFIAASLTLLALGPAAWAQTSKGFIVGTVADPNGAVVPGAVVRVTNANTGVVRETAAQEDGSYRFDAVDPGTYTIEASGPGFGALQREGVEVKAAQTVNVPLQLAVGGASAEVTVVGDSDVTLQSADGARVNTIDQREITDLPVANLNPVNLVFTLPGVSDPAGDTGSLAGGFAQGVEFSVNGLRPRSNNQLVDGTDNNDNSITGQAYIPGLRDGYAEVSVLGGDYSAEYGRAGGAVVNLITRSGTNGFHGSVYDIIQNSSFDALTPGQKAQAGLTEVPKYSQNTFGFSLGGPVVKNKLFFFGTFQADLIRAGGVTSTPVVPTAAGFNQLRALFPAGANPNVDRYLSLIGDMRGTTNARSFPLGGGRPAIEFGTATRTSTQPVNTYDYLARVDWAPTSRDSFAFRYLANDQIFANAYPNFNGQSFPGLEIDVLGLNQNFYVNYTRVFTNNTTNEFRFGYGFVDNVFAARDPEQVTGGPQFTFASGNISSVGLDPTFPQGRKFKNYQFQDTVSHTAGDHTLRFGFDVLVQRGTQLVPINTRGRLTFSSGGGFPELGNFVDQFSGETGTANKVFGAGQEISDNINQAYFINDAWRVTPNLTLNFGLRYENFGAVANNAHFPAFTGFDAPFQTRVEQETDNNNFGPRVSFAYAPKFDSGLGAAILGREGSVLRGGFAVNYDVFFNNILSNLSAAPPNSISTTLEGAVVGGRGIANFSPGALPSEPVPNPQSAQSTILRNLHNPKTYVWNLGVQRQLFGDNILDLAYVGSRGLHLYINEQLNPGIRGSTNPNRRLFASRGSVQARTNGGDSIYHSVQARLERGFRNGFLYRLAYTFSKSIDNTNSEVFITTGGASVGSDPFNRRADRSVSIYDTPHVFSLTALYNTGNLFREGAARHILGGFNFSGVWRYQSGNVETPYVSGFDLNGDLANTNDRPAIANPNAPATSVAFANGFAANFECDPSPTGYFTPLCAPVAFNDVRFVVDRNLRTNIAGRNTLRAPGYHRLDLSLWRSLDVFFSPMENDRFEIRFDLFNATNTPPFRFEAGTGFALADGNVGNEFFNRPELNSGISVGTSQARVGRLQLRYVF